MIAPEKFLAQLHEEGIHFFAGVPDSLMKGFLACLQKQEKDHFITANEGAAVAMATGYHLATKKTGLVYLQNSGLGNIINPITSLANKEVYGIPMLLMIGWRGQPGKKDEPQHKKMGQATLELLSVLDVPHFVFSPGSDWMQQLRVAVALAQQTSHPVALVIEESFFEDGDVPSENEYEMQAQQVMEALYPHWDDNDVILCTTGKLGRLFYSINRQHQNRIRKYFMNVGAMGHLSSVAAGLAKFTDHRVVVLDGDGSLLMHMGTLPVLAQLKLENLVYMVFNNGVHQSVGGQPTAGFQADFCAIAKASGFTNPTRINTLDDLRFGLPRSRQGTQFTEIRINTQMPEQLPRPEESFMEARQRLMLALQSRNS